MNRYIFILFETLLFCWSSNANAQSLFENSSRKLTTNKAVKLSVSTRATAQKAKEKPVLYAHVTKRFGWYCGIGDPLSQDAVQKLPFHYRLYGKTASGNYMRMDVVDGYGRHTTNNDFYTYLTNNEIKKVVQWKMIGDDSGKYVIQESGYDAEGNMIYTYIPTLLNDGNFLGHYTNSYGEPISIGENAKYINVKLDDNGREIEVAFVGDNAYFKTNEDGAYSIKYEYDKDGRRIAARSCAINGFPMIDDWGNCGYIQKYDKRGQLREKLYIDQYDNPIRLSLHMTSTDVVKISYEYDKYGRCIEEKYVDANNNPLPTSGGIYSVSRTYNDKGRIVCEITRDSANHMIDSSKDYAYALFSYDPKGRLLREEYRDQDSLFLQDHACVRIHKYNAKGKCEVDSAFVSQDGNRLKLQELAINKINNHSYLYNYEDNFVIDTLFDDKERIKEVAFYDINNHPIAVDGMHKLCYTYSQRNGLQSTIYEMQGVDGQLLDINDTITYNREVATIDTKTHKKEIHRYDGDKLVATYGQLLDNAGNVRGQYGFDIMGNRARTHLESAFYYEILSGQTYSGETAYMKGVNEYGEPSYIMVGDGGEIFTKRIHHTMFDENGKEIDPDSISGLREKLNKVFFVEITNKIGYDLGLRSGDMIVQYADFCYPQLTTDMWNYANDLQVQSYVSRNEDKDVLVLRYDEAKRKHIMKDIRLPKGTVGQLGFHVIMGCLTTKESERFNNAVAEYMKTNDMQIEKITEKDVDKKELSIIRPYRINTEESESWQKGLHEDAIVVAVEYVDTVSNEIKTRLCSQMGVVLNDLSKENIDSITYYYTTDGKTLHSIKLNSRRTNLYTSYYGFPTDEYNTIVALEQHIKATNQRKGDDNE